jgi:AcrR family transcriptional regulator
MSKTISKKDRIASAFRQRFEAVGYQRTALDDIAKSLQISKKTIYKFFANKRGVFDYLIEKRSIHSIRKINKQLENQSTDRKKIEWLVSQSFLLSRDRLKFTKATNSRYKNELILAAKEKALFESFKTTIMDGARRNVFIIKDLDLTVNIIHGIIVCANQLIDAKPSIKIEPEIKRTILKLLLP